MRPVLGPWSYIQCLNFFATVTKLALPPSFDARKKGSKKMPTSSAADKSYKHTLLTTPASPEVVSKGLDADGYQLGISVFTSIGTHGDGDAR